MTDRRHFNTYKKNTIWRVLSFKRRIINAMCCCCMRQRYSNFFLLDKFFEQKNEIGTVKWRKSILFAVKCAYYYYYLPF